MPLIGQGSSCANIGQPWGRATRAGRAGLANRDCHAPHTDRQGLQGYGESGQRTGECITGQGAWQEGWPSAAARLCSMDDGSPGGLVLLDGKRDAKTPRPKGWRNAALKALGNAVVPAQVYPIYAAIAAIEARGERNEHPRRGC